MKISVSAVSGVIGRRVYIEEKNVPSAQHLVSGHVAGHQLDAFHSRRCQPENGIARCRVPCVPTPTPCRELPESLDRRAQVAAQ